MADQLTEFQKKALTIIRDNSGIGTYSLARKLWPGNNFKRPWLVVGAQVGKLVNRGWVWREYMKGYNDRSYFRGYVITTAGRKILGENHD